MVRVPIHRSYLVCATPRSGSTLLCRSLGATGIAGKPEEYFERLRHSGLSREPREYFEGAGPEVVALLPRTRVGDPAETWAIGTTIAQRRAAPLPIGSVKTNIGHLEPASGMAGLLKAMLMLEKGALVPSLHFAEPNPEIDFAGLNLAVTTRHEALPAAPDAVVGINSFGFGGTNATVLLGRAPAISAAPAGRAGGTPPLVLSARSEAALGLLAAQWRDRLDHHAALSFDEAVRFHPTAQARGREIAARSGDAWIKRHRSRS